MNVLIRQETGSDFSEVYKLNHTAFGQENEGKLVNALRNNSQVFIPELSCVAVVENKIVGHILFSKIKIKDNKKEFEALSLAPMSVAPEFQKQGIGGKLINYGLNKAKELGYKSVIVLGHEDYYPKFGFVPTEKWQIKSPFDVKASYFMGIELVEDGLKNVKGTVQYPKEFETV